MFNVVSYFTLSLAAVSSVSGLVIPRGAPAGYNTAVLEPYDVYHTRYLALECQNKHDQPFFDQCCHPMLASQKLSSLPKQCDPASTAPPASNDDDGEEDCDEDEGSDDDDNTVVVVTPTPAVAPPPAPTTTPKATSTPKPTPTPAATTERKPQPTSPAPSSSLIKGGFATFFFQNGVAGACGKVHQDSDLVAAMDSRRYGNTSVRSSLCGKKVRITNTKNKKSVTVVVADACPTCNNGNSIDLSDAAFKAIANPDEGIVPIEWSFV